MLGVYNTSVIPCRYIHINVLFCVLYLSFDIPHIVGDLDLKRERLQRTCMVGLGEKQDNQMTSIFYYILVRAELRRQGTVGNEHWYSSPPLCVVYLCLYMTIPQLIKAFL